MDSKIIIWNSTTGQSIYTLTGHLEGVSCLVSILNENQIVSASYDKAIIIWDANTSEKLKKLTGHNSYVYSLTVLGDNRLASSSMDRTIKIWNLISGQEMHSLRGFTNSVFFILALPENRLACGSFKTIEIRNVQSDSEVIYKLVAHTDEVNYLIRLKDGFTMASASGDKTIKVWNFETGVLIKTLEGHADEVTALALLEDGRLISCSKSEEKSVIIWK